MSKLDCLEVDLINLSEWAGSTNSRRYAVSIIDCFSKYAWLLPITQKKAKKVLEVLGPFLKEHTPKVLQSDNRGGGSSLMPSSRSCLMTSTSNILLASTTFFPI